MSKIIAQLCPANSQPHILKYLLLAYAVISLQGCATTFSSAGHSAKQTTLFVPTSNFYLNDNLVREFDAQEIEPGSYQLKYDGQLFTYIPKPVKQKSAALRSAGCILTLPLCVMDKIVPSASANLTSQNSWCRGELRLQIAAGRHYEVAISNAYSENPSIVVWEFADTVYRKRDKILAQTVLTCAPNEHMGASATLSKQSLPGVFLGVFNEQ